MTPERRLVVSKRYTGLGDCITSLLGAWRFALRTQRMLVADWRFSCYASSRTHNVFADVFQAPAELAGVPFLGDDRVNDLRPTGSFFMPEIWDAERLHEPPTSGERGDPEAVLTLLRGTGDTPEDVVVFERCLAGGYATPSEARTFLQALLPRPGIAGSIERFAADHFTGHHVIGVHVRHGNGGNIMGYAPYWSDPAGALQHLTASIWRAYWALHSRGDRPIVVFLCTDSAVIEEYGRTHWPNVVSRPKRFRPLGAGELHLGPDSGEGLHDAVVEMLLLARSSVLVRYPDSMFSYVASCLKPPDPIGTAPESCRE